ncbi:hypothetical protein GQX74_004109 [Glossina fuscipes]|nr:hypothetical protein GQX74_004109 [Glossina fuscipes]
MIIQLFLIIVFLAVFFCVNIYSKTIQVAYQGHGLINETITFPPWTDRYITSSTEDALSNAHHCCCLHRRCKADPVHAIKLKS